MDLQGITRAEIVHGPRHAVRYDRPDMLRDPDGYIRWAVEHANAPAGELRPLDFPLIDDAYRIGPAAAPAERMWFVVVTAPGKEKSVADDLRHDGIEPCAPEKVSFRRRAGSVEKHSVIARPLLPGYVFAGLPEAAGGISRLLAPRHAISVLPRPDAARRVPAAEIERLKRMEAAGEFDETLRGPKGWGKGLPSGQLSWIRPGVSILVETGPFAGHCGRITLIEAYRRRVKALLPLFGGEISVELEFAQFRAAV